MTDRITVTRTFTAPREVLWNVVTAREQFATWFGTEAVDVPLDTLDWSLVEGERWSAVMHLPDGTTKPWIGDFVEVVPPSHFAIRLTDQPEQPDELAPVTIDLAEVGGGTELTLTQETPGWPDDARAGLTAGYGAFLDSMERLVERAR